MLPRGNVTGFRRPLGLPLCGCFGLPFIPVLGELLAAATKVVDVHFDEEGSALGDDFLSVQKPADEVELATFYPLALRFDAELATEESWCPEVDVEVGGDCGALDEDQHGSQGVVEDCRDCSAVGETGRAFLATIEAHASEDTIPLDA